MRKKIGFKLRPFISYFLTFSFIHLILSSIILYIAPPGRFANYANWKILGITKGGWDAQHTIMGYLFIIAVIVHLILNWNVFLSYVRSKIRKAVNRIWELAAAVLLIVLLTVGTAFNWIPFSSVMDIGDTLSNSWEANSQGVSGSGGGDETGNIAAVETSNSETEGVGQGMGKKDLKTVIEENGVDLESALKKLKAKGIDAKPDENMKKLSTRIDMGFSDIIAIITE